MDKMQEYISTYISEITSKYDRLGKIIKHSYSEGVFRENILKEILGNFLSPAVGIKNGFIKSKNEDNVSRQTDIILVNENLAFAYYYNDKNISIVRSDAVVCAIEVKSNFAKRSLKEVSDNLNSIKSIDKNIRYSAFFYKSKSKNQETIDKWFKDSFIIPDGYLYYPDRLSILDYGVFMIDKNKTINKWTLTYAKPVQQNINKSQTQILTDFAANAIGYCSKIINNDKSNPFKELGFGDWEKFETISYV